MLVVALERSRPSVSASVSRQELGLSKRGLSRAASVRDETAEIHFEPQGIAGGFVCGLRPVLLC